MTLVGVITQFLKGKTGWTRTMMSDGHRLLSYGVVIGEWDNGRVVLPEADRFYSRTTSRHRNLLRELATSRGMKIEQVAGNRSSYD